MQAYIVTRGGSMVRPSQKSITDPVILTVKMGHIGGSVTSQRLLDQNQVGPHHIPPFWAHSCTMSQGVTIVVLTPCKM